LRSAQHGKYISLVLKTLREPLVKASALSGPGTDPTVLRLRCAVDPGAAWLSGCTLPRKGEEHSRAKPQAASDKRKKYLTEGPVVV